jgi:hypothetical protein
MLQIASLLTNAFQQSAAPAREVPQRRDQLLGLTGRSGLDGYRPSWAKIRHRLNRTQVVGATRLAPPSRPSRKTASMVNSAQR